MAATFTTVVLLGAAEVALRRRALRMKVLGCGAYRIGSSVEFDWCPVSAKWI
jgi:hypothetical protein